MVWAGAFEALSAQPFVTKGWKLLLRSTYQVLVLLLGGRDLISKLLRVCRLAATIGHPQFPAVSRSPAFCP